MNKTAPSSQPDRKLRGQVIRIHRWLGVGAAGIWMLQALTGILLSFHFELDDALLSSSHPPTDHAAIERRLEAMVSDEADASINWLWTTAGLPDRYLVSYFSGDGHLRLAHINGAGEVLRDAGTTEHTFLRMMRQIHINLAAGITGHILLIVTGTLLITNILFGLVIAWPRNGRWRAALSPTGKGHPVARAFSWHRAIGLWGALPALIIVTTGTLILLEHEIGDLIGAHENTLPAIVLEGPPVGVGAAITTALEALPGSRFAGTTLPSAEDASYYVWVRAPGELYRGGYGGSLVIVDANTAAVRGAWPVTEANAANAFVASFYPLHTGEAAGLPGRILAMLTGVWLITVIVFGALLWLRRRNVNARAKES